MLEENYGIIYKYTCKITGKSYIGKTDLSNLKNRQHRHKTDKIDLHFYRARDKYGMDNFEFSIVEDHIDKSILDEREIYWISYYDSFKNGYNSTRGGEGGNTYEGKSEEDMKIIRKKLFDSKLGEKNPMSKEVMVTNTITKEEKHFCSFTEAGKFFGVNRVSIRRWIEKRKVINNWQF